MHPPRRRGLGSADGSGRAGAQNNVALFCGPRNNFWLFCGPQNTHQVVLRHRRFVLWRVRLCAGGEVGRQAGARRVLGLGARTPLRLTCAHVRRRGVPPKKKTQTLTTFGWCVRGSAGRCVHRAALCAGKSQRLCGVELCVWRSASGGAGLALHGRGAGALACTHPPAKVGARWRSKTGGRNHEHPTQARLQPDVRTIPG